MKIGVDTDETIPFLYVVLEETGEKIPIALFTHDGYAEWMERVLAEMCTGSVTVTGAHTALPDSGEDQ